MEGRIGGRGVEGRIGERSGREDREEKWKGG